MSVYEWVLSQSVEPNPSEITSQIDAAKYASRGKPPRSFVARAKRLCAAHACNWRSVVTDFNINAEQQSNFTRCVVNLLLVKEKDFVIDGLCNFLPSHINSTEFKQRALPFLSASVMLRVEQSLWEGMVVNERCAMVADSQYAHWRCASLPGPVMRASAEGTLQLLSRFAFASSGIVEIDLSACKTLALGERVFMYTWALKVATLPICVKQLLPGLFYASSIEHIKAKGARLIGCEAFKQCSELKKCEFSDSNIEIGYAAFQHTSALSEFNFNGVTRIWSEAFECSGVKNVFVDGTCDEIGRNCFKKSMVEVADFSRARCNFWCETGVLTECKRLKEVILPDHGQFLCSVNFASESGVQVVTGPCKSFCKNAFIRSTNLTTVTALQKENTTFIGTRAFMGTNLSGMLHVSNPSVASFAFVTGEFAVKDYHSYGISEVTYQGSNIIAFESDAKEVGRSAFMRCYNLSSVSLPRCVMWQPFCFHRTALKSINIIDDSTVGNFAFASSNLQTITIGRGCLLLQYAFSELKYLKPGGVRFSSSQVEMQKFCFYTSLTTSAIILPNVIPLGSTAYEAPNDVLETCFRGWDGLRNIYIKVSPKDFCNFANFRSAAEKHACMLFSENKRKKITFVLRPDDVVMYKSYVCAKFGKSESIKNLCVQIALWGKLNGLQLNDILKNIVVFLL